MKKVIMLVFAILATLNLFGQAEQPSKGKNHFFSINSGLSVGYRYKRQVSDRMWWRGGIDQIGMAVNLNQPNPGSFELRLGVETGLEWRRTYDSGLTFLHGPGIGLSNHMFVNPGVAPMGSLMGISLHHDIGLMAGITDHLSIAAELMPGITYYGPTGTFSSARNLVFGSTSGIARISLVFVP